eukprot:3993785-Amphidinium_carterae.1
MSLLETRRSSTVVSHTVPALGKPREVPASGELEKLNDSSTRSIKATSIDNFLQLVEAMASVCNTSVPLDAKLATAPRNHVPLAVVVKLEL